MVNLQSIKDLAEKRKMPLTELAAQVGISEQQLHLIVRKNSTKIETLEKIAKVLNVPVSYFFDEEEATVDAIPAKAAKPQPAEGTMAALLAEKDERIAELKERIEELKERIAELKE